jgi:Putative ATP-dependent Lon protease
MKGYMASGQFSRGKESIRAEGSVVMVGNLDVDVEQQQKVGHLLSPMPPEMRDDTAFMDRIHAYAPGWDYNAGDHCVLRSVTLVRKVSRALDASSGAVRPWRGNTYFALYSLVL